MKNLMLIGGVVLMLSAVGCKKDYTCSCDGYSAAGIEIAATDYEYKKIKKTDAEDACDLQSTAWKLLGSSGCTLK